MKMKHLSYFSLFWLLIAGLSISCTEIYTPDIDAPEGVLVVNALITDQAGPYRISLNYAQPYDSVTGLKRIINAGVFVTDDQGNRFDFKDAGAGEYLSDPESFTADTATVYTLNIETPDHSVYQSEPVKMIKTATTESAYGIFSKRKFLIEDVDNTPLVEEKDWITIYLNMLITGQNIPGIRFDPRLVVFSVYYLDPTGGGDVSPYFAWRTFYQDLRVISAGITESKGSGGNTAFNDREISSFEYREFIKARDAYTEIDTMNSRILRYALILGQYQLNESSRIFYDDLTKQVQSENRIFDPLPVDVRGNIRCTSDPSRKVIGLFEVSAYRETAYSIVTRKDSKEVTITPVDVMIPNPPLGSVPDVPPWFWIN